MDYRQESPTFTCRAGLQRRSCCEISHAESTAEAAKLFAPKHLTLAVDLAYVAHRPDATYTSFEDGFKSVTSQSILWQHFVLPVLNSKLKIFPEFDASHVYCFTAIIALFLLFATMLMVEISKLKV